MQGTVQESCSGTTEGLDGSFDVMEAVERCFQPLQKNSDGVFRTGPCQQNVTTEISDDSENETLFESENIFMYYDTNKSNIEIELKIDRAMCKLEQQSRKIKQLEKCLFKSKKSDFKPVCIKTQEGRQFLCMFCKFISKSWGKGYAHIAEFHIGTKMCCKSCKFATFNPDSFNRHKKKHVN